MVRRRTFLGVCLAGGLAFVLAHTLRSTNFLKKPTPSPRSPSYSDTTIDVHAISQLLWAAQGITRRPFRAAPSAGGTYPLDIYVVIGNDVDGIAQGVYHYIPEDHKLQLILKDDKRAQLAQAFDNKASPCIEQASILLVITAVYERTTKKYGTRGIQYVHLEIGHVAQNVLLQATSLGLTATCLPVFNEDRIKHLLETPDPLLVIPIGNLSPRDIRISPKDNSQPKDPTSLPTVSSMGTMTVEETIAQRRSIRTYSSGEIPLEKFSKMLWTAQGVKDPDTNVLTFPSLSRTYPVTIYAVIGRVTGLMEGVYQYFPGSHSLERIRKGDFVDALVTAGLEQPWIREAQMNFVISADYQKVRENFGDLGERIACFEVGQVAENIYLEAQALGLGTVVIGAFHDSQVRKIVKMPINQTPLYIVPLGLRTD